MIQFARETVTAVQDDSTLTLLSPISLLLYLLAICYVCGSFFRPRFSTSTSASAWSQLSTVDPLRPLRPLFIRYVVLPRGVHFDAVLLCEGGY